MRNVRLYLLSSILLLAIISILLSNSFGSRETTIRDANVIYPNTWWLSIGGSEDDQAWSGIFVDEQGYVYCIGQTSSWKPLGASSLFIVKNSRYGENVRSIIVYGNSSIIGRDILVSNNYMYIVGQLSGYGAGSVDGFIAKLRDNGERAWFITVGGSAADLLWSIAPGPNDVIYASGYTFSFGSGKVDAFVVKVDSTGRLIWSSALGGPNYDYGWWIDVFANETNEYVAVAGQTNSYGFGGYDGYVTLLSGEGMPLWTVVFGTPAPDQLWGVKFDKYGYIYVAGGTSNTTTGKLDVYVAKIDLNGRILWIRSFGGGLDDLAYSLAVDDMYVYVTGFTYSYATGSSSQADVLLAVLNKDTGDAISFLNIGGPDVDFGYAVTVDENYVYITGKTGSFSEGGIDLYQAKLEKNYILDPDPPDLVWLRDDFPENINVSRVNMPSSYPSFSNQSVSMAQVFSTPTVMNYQMPTMLIGPNTHIATASGQPPAIVITTTETNVVTSTVTDTETSTVTRTETIRLTERLIETLTSRETSTVTSTETVKLTETLTSTVTETSTITKPVTLTTEKMVTETLRENLTETSTVTTVSTVPEIRTDYTSIAIVGIVLLVIGYLVGYFLRK